MAVEQLNVTQLISQGRVLSNEAALQLEEQLQAIPDDLSSRVMLLAYYDRRAFESGDARKQRQKHILWIIQNRPDSEIAGLYLTQLHPFLDEGAYSEAKELWLKQVQVHSSNAVVLGNAASFFMQEDNKLAERFLKQAQDLEPNNPEWFQRLGYLYSLEISKRVGDSRKEIARKSLNQFENALQNTAEKKKRFYMLTILAKTAFESDDMGKAESYATDLLTAASDYQDDWNYGNAIHQGNLILGRITLKSGDLVRAKEYLLKSGKTPGSPQLNSFGPNMSLARDLLEKGESQIVLQYLSLCKTFWDGHEATLEQWISEIQNGSIPDFGANLSY